MHSTSAMPALLHCVLLCCKQADGQGTVKRTSSLLSRDLDRTWKNSELTARAK
jgi:hypothetical protein